VPGGCELPGRFSVSPLARAPKPERAAVGWSSLATRRDVPVDPRNLAPLQHGRRTPAPAERRRALAAVAAYLSCPVCAGPLYLRGSQLACGRHHGFDIARHGYVSLTAGRAGPGTADTTVMVAARDQFLSRGHYQPLAAALQSLAARHDPGTPGLAVDLAGGTGYYLAGILDALPHRHGVCLDVSVPALRRAARAHPRAAALGADIWQPLPLADRSAAVMVSIFGPRNPTETGRVLTPGGALLIAAPGTGHLRELQQPLGMIGIERRKPQRLAATYRDYARSGVTSVNYQLSLDHADLTALVSMGPSVRHITPQALAARISSLPSPFIVTVDLQIRVFQRPAAVTTRRERKPSIGN
jgi:23S rRNA (guanine745-N1)-methyltransferase